MATRKPSKARAVSKKPAAKRGKQKARPSAERTNPFRRGTSISAEAYSRIETLKHEAEQLHDKLTEIESVSGPSRELSVAFTKLEESVMWATKAIAVSAAAA